MKTLTQQEYDALPIEKRRYWKERNKIVRQHGISKFIAPELIIDYTPIQINLEDAEGAIREVMMKVNSHSFHAIATRRIDDYLTEALNKLKGV